MVYNSENIESRSDSNIDGNSIVIDGTGNEFCGLIEINFE
tara:strand:+ start:454 stop:573 length:120 start_codon:yes stop_codon:yes gene_type:complete